ncbi:hypothetical protein PAAG_05995 [Paracoccidioides lutzii Pb01]|uniref:Glucose-methanol-choline oxidoreductase N-terminal domain-containing protein n=1 Tax=Paracoccidioides lutzii (strain ATCC MYA-826 / Pb01) TaxID=502779 RepID=C1H5F4_PARBA|nr:hypothetical protein PAAG_05995 [Paracoccidioides lutzii Pb01]EEH34948.2 hypothetical protein PAAG_05995 [Paracoccidioides lutzii Pb01]
MLHSFILSRASRSWWCALLLFASLVTSSAVTNGRGKWEKRNDNEYDYIIVGGGLTGLVAAHRLSENSRAVSVLVLEYGVIDRSDATKIPYMGSFLNFPNMFNITTAPEPGLEGRSYSVRAGSVVGGGTTVNGMTYDRASAADYDSWEKLGNRGWGWQGLLPYFKKSAQFTPPPQEVVDEYEYTYDQSAYGSRSPLKITYPHWQAPDLYKMSDAFTEMGIPFRNEHASGDAIGKFWAPASIDAKTMTRSSSLTAYYDTASSRDNLKLLTEHQVIRLTFNENSKNVSGVKAINRKSNKEVTFRAKREVILAAGAIHTPQLLQLSGIGPKAVVEAAGIKSKVDLPGVGSNLQDHPVAYLNWRVANNFPEPNAIAINATFAAEALELYNNLKTGPYTKAQTNMIAFLTLSMITDDVDAMIKSLNEQNSATYLPTVYSNSALLVGFEAQRNILANQLKEGSVAAMELPISGSGSVPNSIQKPLSRGTVHLNPNNPRGEPIVTYHALKNPFDRALIATFVNFTRRYFKTTALASLKPEEVSPGVEAQTEDEIIAKLIAGGPLSFGPSFAHPSCSCPMMPRAKGGCVSADLLVYGTKRLSIIDASIMPIIPAAHLQASVYAIAEKAADIIKRRG